MIGTSARAQQPAADRAHDECSRDQRGEGGAGASGMTKESATRAAADKPALLTVLIGHSARILELSAGHLMFAIYTMLGCKSMSGHFTMRFRFRES